MPFSCFNVKFHPINNQRLGKSCVFLHFISHLSSINTSLQTSFIFPFPSPLPAPVSTSIILHYMLHVSHFLSRCILCRGHNSNHDAPLAYLSLRPTGQMSCQRRWHIWRAWWKTWTPSRRPECISHHPQRPNIHSEKKTQGFARKHPHIIFPVSHERTWCVRISRRGKRLQRKAVRWEGSLIKSTYSEKTGHFNLVVLAISYRYFFYAHFMYVLCLFFTFHKSKVWILYGLKWPCRSGFLTRKRETRVSSYEYGRRQRFLKRP